MKKFKATQINQTQDQILKEKQMEITFQNQFQGMLSRQHTKQFHLIDSPNIIYNLSMIRPLSVCSNLEESHIKKNFKCKKEKSNNQNSDNNPKTKAQKQKLKKSSLAPSRNSFTFLNQSTGQRDKYRSLKEKLIFFIKNIENQEDFYLSEILEYKQIILKQFLFSIISDLKRQCKQKGQLVEFVWNNMFLLINKILSALTDKKNIVQKCQLLKSINQHQSYHSLIQNKTKKLDQIQLKSKQSHQIISKLVYQLRFKRKQVKKLYAHLHKCTQKLNQFKNSYFDVQNQHINLLMATKDISRQQAVYLFQKREQINKEAQIKIRLNQNRKKIEKQIKQELAKQNGSFMNQNKLIQYLKGLTKLESSEQKSAFIAQMLQNLSTVDQAHVDTEIIKLQVKNQKRVSIGTQMQDFFKFSTYIQSQSSQTTYSDKIENQLICTMATQTVIPKNFIKKFQNKQVQADGDAMRIVLIKKKLLIYRTLNLDFYFSTKYRENDKPSLTFQPIITSESEFQRNPKMIQSLIPDKAQPIIQKTYISHIQRSSSKNKNLKLKTKISNQQQRKSVYEGTRSINRKSNSRFANHNRRVSQNSSNEYESLKKQPDRLGSPITDKLTTEPNFSIKRHRSSVFAQNQNTDLIEFNQAKSKFIQKNLRNSKKEYYVIDQKRIIQNFKQNLNEDQKNLNLFNRTLPEKQAKTTFLNNTMSNFSKLKHGTLKQKRCRNINQLGQFKATFNNFTNFNGQNTASPLIFKTIDKILLKSLIKVTSNLQNYKQCKQKSNFNSIFDKLNPLIMDVLNMINRQPDYAKKRHRNNLNIKNFYKILMLVYSKAFDLMNRKVILQTLALPLFQTFQVIYGTLKIQDIYKKMIAFIVGMVSTENNQIFKTFIFFFGLQNLGQGSSSLSDKITTADTVLFLKLLQKLNIGSKLGTDIQSAFTTIQKVKQSLNCILDEQQIPKIVIKQVLAIVQRKFDHFQQFLSEKGTKKTQESQTKLNLFKMSRIIVEQIIKIRQNLINTFQPLFDIWKSQERGNSNSDTEKNKNTGFQNQKKQKLFKQTGKQSERQGISIKQVQKIIKCCKLNSIQQLQVLKLLRQISKINKESQNGSENMLIEQNQTVKSSNRNANRTITKNQFSSLILRLNILNFQQILKMNQKQLTLFKQLGKKHTSNSGDQYVWFNEAKANNQNNQKFKKVADIQNAKKIHFLCLLQEETGFQLQKILGELNFVYQLSVFSILPQKKVQFQN